jgi:predicted enzyme related to lactoylglutathione lyase
MRRPAGFAVRPVWAELGVPAGRLDAVARFYGRLLGWSLTSSQDGGYCTGFVGREPVAGLVRVEPDGTGSSWTVFIGVSDVPGVVEAARSRGASVVSPPMQVMEFGRVAVPGDQRAADPWRFPGTDREIATMAVLADPQQTLLGLWSWRDRDRPHRGDTVGMLRGAVHLSEDPDGARSCCRDVLGTQADAEPLSSGEGDGTIGALGFVSVPPGLGGLGPLWVPVFAVSDLENAVGSLVRLAGRVVDPRPPVGRDVVLAVGPAGEIVGLTIA